MTKFYTKDYDLTAVQLDDKYNSDGDGEHPGFPRSEWREAVACEETTCGYWDWVWHKLGQEQEKLDRDSPFSI